MALAALAATPAATAADRGSLTSAITTVSPVRLTGSTDVTLAGTVTNDGKTGWSDVQAYLVIRPAPLTSRTALAQAIDEDPGYAGPRVVEVGLFDELGDMAPGTTRNFTITVPAEQLPISGAEGVYPVGVQVLATDASGRRSNDAVTRAVTVIPLMTGDHAPAPTTVVWCFFMPVPADADGEPADVEKLLATIRPGGRLRDLLDVAIARGDDGRGVIVDPALVAAVDDLAEGRTDADLTDADQSAVEGFRDDLVSIAKGPSAWILDWDRTDVLSLVDDSSRRRRLFGAVERATETVVQDLDLSNRRVSWPVSGGVTQRLLSTLRSRGDDPAVVRSSDLTGWDDTSGSLVDVPTPGGDLPLLVDDDVTAGMTGPLTVATLRQQVLATSAFASLSRDEDSSSMADGLVVVSPSWHPDADDPAVRSGDSWTGPFGTPTDLDDVPRDNAFTGSVPRTTSARTLPGPLLRAVDEAYRSGDVLASTLDDRIDADDQRARSIANLLGVRWRSMRTEGVQAARRLERQVTQKLDGVSVMGPGSVTLSSAEGAFPLTITNDTAQAVSVGVRLSSSNPAVRLPEQEPVEISAGERVTTTVEVDLRQQNATTVTAQLVTPSGRAFGQTTEFNVRSSSVGTVLWITMAAAGVFVLLALARRFGRRRSTRPRSEQGPADE